MSGSAAMMPPPWLPEPQDASAGQHRLPVELHKMSMSMPRPTTITVCRSCGDEMGTPQSEEQCPGTRLLHLLEQRLAGTDLPLRTQGVPCMAVCDQPVTVAFQAENAWSYVVGGIDPERDIDGLIKVAHAIANTEHGVPSLAERPRFFREGTICRLAPLPAQTTSKDD